MPENVTAQATPAAERASRSTAPARISNGAGFWRNAPMRSLVVLAFSLVAAPALAASADAGGERRAVSASLDFRIVIPETLHIDSMPQRRSKSLAFVSRTTHTQDGRTVVTVARP